MPTRLLSSLSATDVHARVSPFLSLCQGPRLASLGPWSRSPGVVTSTPSMRHTDPLPTIPRGSVNVPGALKGTGVGRRSCAPVAGGPVVTPTPTSSEPRVSQPSSPPRGRRRLKDVALRPGVASAILHGPHFEANRSSLSPRPLLRLVRPKDRRNKGREKAPYSHRLPNSRQRDAGTDSKGRGLMKRPNPRLARGTSLRVWARVSGSEGSGERPRETRRRDASRRRRPRGCGDLEVRD